MVIMVVVMVMVALAQWQRLYIVDGGVMVEAEAAAMREYDSGISNSKELLAIVLVVTVVGVMVAAAWWLKWRSQWQ